jgi:hypothetical protein
MYFTVKYFDLVSYICTAHKRDISYHIYNSLCNIMSSEKLLYNGIRFSSKKNLKAAGPDVKAKGQKEANSSGMRGRSCGLRPLKPSFR